MSTIDKLNNDILELRNEIDSYKKEVIKLLLKQRTEHRTVVQEWLDDDIKFVRSLIHFNNQIIRENEKQIAADKEAIAADKRAIVADKEAIAADKRAIVADKEKDAANAKFRAERGEINSSPCLLFSFLDNNIILRPLLASFLKLLVGMQIFWRQLFSRLFGPPLRLTEYSSTSTGAGQSSSGTDQSSVKQPTPIDTPYCTFSFISARAQPSLLADSSNSYSPSYSYSDSDCGGVEMKSMEIQSLEPTKSKNEDSSLRHRVKDMGQEGADNPNSSI